MGRGSQDQAEQADPADLVDEGGQPRPRGDEKPQGEPGIRIALRTRCPHRCFRCFHGPDFSRQPRAVQPIESRPDDQIPEGGRLQRSVGAEGRYEPVGTEKDANGSSQGVSEIEQWQRGFPAVAEMPDHPRGEEGESHAQQSGEWQRQQKAEQDLDRAGDRGAGRVEGGGPIKEPGGEPLVSGVKGNPENGGDHFDPRIGKEGVADFSDPPGREERSEPEASHEDDQGDDLAIGGMPEKKLQVARPKRFVNQGDRPGEAEKKVDQKTLHALKVYEIYYKYKFYIRGNEGSGCHSLRCPRSGRP